MAEVRFFNEEFLIKITDEWDGRGKTAPDGNFDKKLKIWRLTSILSNAEYIKDQFDRAELSKSTSIKIRSLFQANRLKTRPKFPSKFKFKNPPRSHQQEALDFSYGLEEVAWFMEMRTGKSFVAICDAAAHFIEGHINAMVVVCLTPNKPVWEIQLEEHCPIEYEAHIIESGQKKVTEEFLRETFFANESNNNVLPVLIVGIEGLSQGHAHKYLYQFIKENKVAIYIDESDAIKTYNSARTEKCIVAGEGAEFRRILTGTEITQGIEDLYSQFRFLNWRIIGMKSYFTFRARHCVMGGFEGKKITGYLNIKELMEKLSPYVYRCEAKDVIDLPPQIFEQRFVDPNKEQKRLLKELGDPFLMATSIDDKELEVETVLERMIRYQQIAGGMFPFDDEEGGYDQIVVPGVNPKLAALIDDVHKIRPEDKIIIWAVFRPEVAMITEFIRENFGRKSFVEYHGGTDKSVRKEYLLRFQNDPDCRFFITNKTGSRGTELSAANVHLFFSNSFSYGDRKQAMARTNSAEQKKSVLYIDYRLNHKIDVQIHNALMNKKSMADYVRSKLR